MEHLLTAGIENDDAGERALEAALKARSRLVAEPVVDRGALQDGWSLARDFFADGRSLDTLLAYQARFNPTADTKSLAAFLLSDVTHLFTAVAVPLAFGAGVVANFDPGCLAIRPRTHVVQHEGKPVEIQTADVRLLAPPVLVAVDGAAPEVSETVRREVEGFFAPLLVRLQSRTGLSVAAGWRLVGDSLGAGYLEAGRRLNRLDAAVAAATAVLKQPGSPLNNRQFHFFQVTVEDEADPGRIVASGTYRSRGGCCRYYRVNGGKLCTTCVLQEPEARDALIRAALRRHLGLPRSDASTTSSR